MQCLKTGRFKEAEQQLRRAMEVAPRHVEARFALGILLAQTDRWPEANNHLEFVVAAFPARDQALYWLAMTKKSLGDPAAGAELCERALAVDNRNPTVLNELGLCRMTLNQPEPAADAFRKAIASNPLKGVYHFNLGLALFRLDRIHKAREAFEESLRLDPNRIEAYLELARLLEILDARQHVVGLLTTGVKRHPNEPQLLTALAAAVAYVGNKVKAEEFFRLAVTGHPVSASAFGLWLQQEGRFAESIECFLSSLSAEPNQGVAFYGLAEAKAFEIDGESWIERAEPLVDSDELDLKGRTYLCYALARAYERRQDSNNTIKHFDLANETAYRLYNEGRPFNREQLTGLTDQAIETYSPHWLNGPAPGASDSDCPIFIVGMIRSGTTLLDQILSRHPEVKSAGEPVFWMRESDRVRRMPSLTEEQVEDLAARYLKALESAAGHATRISDKMPLNYAHVGLIHRTFPKAKIIHLRRNPLDTCFSIYTTYLGRGPGFAYNQSNIVFSYGQYLKLMAHWRAVMPAESFLEVDYEALVDSPEPEIRRILEFCRLDFDAACLSSDHAESSIRTPSKWQARQPVYKSSIHRWKPYESRLGDLVDLKDVRHPDLERF